MPVGEGLGRGSSPDGGVAPARRPAEASPKCGLPGAEVKGAWRPPRVVAKWGMASGWRIAAAALALAALGAAAPAPARAQQPQAVGCLAAGNCGTKGTTPGARRDYWYNWICSGCHTGATEPLAPTPQEYALLQVPVRFWTMHAEATRDGETRMRAGQHGLKPQGSIAAPFVALMRNRPARQ